LLSTVQSGIELIAVKNKKNESLKWWRVKDLNLREAPHMTVDLSEP
jgi:hypothetical protein